MIDFEQFEKDWKKRHKASLPRKQSVSSASTFFWISFWIVVSTGAAVFSGAHTIPAALMTLFASMPLREYLAITAFVIVEFVIFGAAAKRHEIKWLNILLVCSLFVAFIGNTSSSIQAVTQNGGDWLNQIGGFLLSVIAPVTALAAGEVLHIQLSDLARRKEVANEQFQQAWKEVEAKINTAYTKLEKDAKEEVRAMSESLSVRTDNGQASGYGYSKRTDAKEVVRVHLEKNPHDIDKTVRELAEILGVGKSTVSDVKRELLSSANGQSMNGNGANDTL